MRDVNASPNVVVARPRKALKFGTRNAILYPACGDARFLKSDFELPEGEKKIFKHLMLRVKQEYPDAVVYFISTDELEVCNNYSEADAKLMGERARKCYEKLFQEAGLKLKKDYSIHAWSEYLSKSQSYIQKIRDLYGENRAFRKLIDKIIRKHLNRANNPATKSTDSRPSLSFEDCKEFIFIEYGVTAYWRKEFGDLVILQMLCSSERRNVLIKWISNSRYFPMEDSGKIQLLTFYREGSRHMVSPQNAQRQPENPIHTMFSSARRPPSQPTASVPGYTGTRVFLDQLSEKFDDFTPDMQRLIATHVDALRQTLAILEPEVMHEANAQDKPS